MRTQVAPKTRSRWNDCHMGLAAHRTFLLGVKQQLPMKSIAVLWRVIIWSMWQSMLSLKCLSKDQAAVPAQYSSKGPLKVGLGQCHQQCHCPCQARCPGPHQPPPSTHTCPQREGTASLSTGAVMGEKHPIRVKSSFGSLIKKQGSQHRGIDFHQLISITSFHHQLPYSTKLLETIFIDCSSSRQKRPWLIICYPQTPCAFQIITWCSREEMNWMCSQ